MSEIQQALVKRYMSMSSEQFRNVFEAQLHEMYIEQCATDGDVDNISDDDRMLAAALTTMFRIRREYPFADYYTVSKMIFRMLHMNDEQISNFQDAIDGWAMKWGDEE